ncbi:MAG TPA: HAMP domain-containing sensor histidine kinase [Thermoanaerobaculia bacterium]|jgi:signal transduction histidine kinase
MKAEDSGPVLVGEEFLSLVSHEIKNPLTSITGYADFAEDAVKNNDHSSALESLEIVRSEARRILRLAEDLLDASCVKAGKFRLNVGQVDVAGLVGRIVTRYAATSGRKIEVCAPSLFPVIRGDSCRIAQVIENLVSNAIKYSPDATPIRVLLDADPAAVHLSISNGGTMIPPEKLAMLFQRFSRLRVDGDGNGTRKGTGLGLFISKQIVELHGGSINVTSTEAEGTTFTVVLPRAYAGMSDEQAN